MSNHVISAKLSEEELLKLKEICQQKGFTPSRLVKEAIAKWMELEANEQKTSRTVETKTTEVQSVNVSTEAENLGRDEFFQYYRKRIDSAKNNESQQWF